MILSQNQLNTAKRRAKTMTKEIKAAIMDNLKYWVCVRNYGHCSTHPDIRQEIILRDNKIKIDHKNNIITQNGEPIFKIERRYSANKSRVYLHNMELTPALILIGGAKK